MKLDSQDKSILERLQRNALLSVAEIAEQINISKSACWRRIQKLEQGGFIRGRVTLLNPEPLQLTLTVYILIKTNQHNEQWAKRFTDVIGNIPQVLEAHRMSGDVDYLLKAVVPDMAGYDVLYKRLITADLFDVSSSFVMETMKETTQLPIFI